MGRPPDAIYVMIRKAGGIRPAPRVRSPRRLSLDDREEISRGLAAGESCRAIATKLSTLGEACRVVRPAYERASMGNQLDVCGF